MKKVSAQEVVNDNLKTGGYVGRFAPSPTGPLHFGSLVAAVGSYLRARSCDGRWLVRMEDIDPLREVDGAADLILRTLEAYGFEWDGDVLWQHTRLEAYQAVLDTLCQRGLAYPCRCSRKQQAESRAALQLPPGVYPGTCRNRAGVDRKQRQAVRLLVEAAEIAFEDRLQGVQQQHLLSEVGDFVLFRADGQFAYQLAVVVDDAAQGITEVVRGSDLLDSTPRQIYLQQVLALPTPRYLHLPVAVNDDGEKLSKQTCATPLPLREPLPSLWRALDFLGQNPPTALLGGGVDEFWQWAISHWQLARVPSRLAVSVLPEWSQSRRHGEDDLCRRRFFNG